MRLMQMLLRQSAFEAQVAAQGSQRPPTHQRRTAHCSSAVHAGIRQPPFPSHMRPPGHLPKGSEEPLGTGLQVPSEPGSAQEVQSWLHAVLQQLPCAQNPLLHSLFEVHGVRSLPLQVPLRHGRPLAQSSSLAQTDLQMPRAMSQANGAQLKPSEPHG